MKKLLIISEDNKVWLTFEELLIMYRPLIRERIYSFRSLKMEIEDRYQIATLGLWTAYEKYDINVGIGFGLFAVTVIDNHLKEVLAYERRVKRSKYLVVSMDRTIEDERDEENAIKDALEADYNIEEDTILKDGLKVFIGRLTDKQKHTISLFMRGNTYKEVANILEVSPTTISMRMTSARKIFRKCMEG